MHILLTGGTGFVGSAYVSHAISRGYKVTVYKYKNTPIHSQCHLLESLDALPDDAVIDVVINLAGAPIAKRWSESYKQALIDSRINTTEAIVALIKRLKQKPTIMISASAIGYYGTQEASKILDEHATPRDEFTHQLCKTWEKAANKAKTYGVRVCIARLGVVLGPGGGALAQMLPSFTCGLGGKIGDGRQAFSWVHRSDVISAFDWFIKHNDAQGVYNVTAPKPVTNEVFTKSLGKALRRPTWFMVLPFMVDMIFGEMGRTLLLNGQYVIPKRLEEEGFSFLFKDINSALKNILM